MPLKRSSERLRKKVAENATKQNSTQKSKPTKHRKMNVLYVENQKCCVIQNLPAETYSVPITGCGSEQKSITKPNRLNMDCVPNNSLIGTDVDIEMSKIPEDPGKEIQGTTSAFLRQPVFDIKMQEYQTEKEDTAQNFQFEQIKIKEEPLGENNDQSSSEINSLGNSESTHIPVTSDNLEVIIKVEPEILTYLAEEEDDIVNLQNNVEFSAEELVKTEQVEPEILSYLAEEEDNIVNLQNNVEFSIEELVRTEQGLNGTCQPQRDSTKKPFSDGDDVEGDQVKIKTVADIVIKCITKERSMNTEVVTRGRSTNKICSAPKSTHIAAFFDIINDSQMKVYDWRHVCWFCRERFYCMSKHLETKHKSDINSVWANNVVLKPEITFKQYIRFWRLGDFYHNLRVLKFNEGELIVLRPSEGYIGQVKRNQFMPCPDCSGFVYKYDLKRHHKKCVLKTNFKVQNRRLLEESQALLSCISINNVRGNCEFKKNVLDKLLTNAGTAAASDRVIMLLSHYMVSQNKCTYSEVRQIIQNMGALLLSCRKSAQNHTLNFQQIMVSNRIPLLLLSIKTLFLKKAESEAFLYNEIITCAFLWRGMCLFQGKLSEADSVLVFYYYFVESWLEEIGCLPPVENSLYKSNFNLGQFRILPLTSNVIWLKESLTSKIVKLTKELKMSRNTTPVLKDLWYSLAETTISLLCIFNPVEFVDIETMKIVEYAVRPDWSVDSLEDYRNKMSYVTHCFIANRFVVCKRNKQQETMIVFTSEIKKAIDVLLTRRKEGGASDDNPYVFSEQCMDNESTFKAASCLYNVCVKNFVLSNDVFHNKKVREFIAHVSQIYDMTPEEVKLVKKYLNTPVTQIERSIGDLVDGRASQVLHHRAINQVLEEHRNDLPNFVSVPENPSEQIKKDIQNEIQRIEDVPGKVRGNKASAHKVYKGKKQTTTNTGNRKLQKRNDWSCQEKRCVTNYFKKELKAERIPGKDKCIMCLAKNNSVLHSKKWQSIKRCVVREIEMRKKLREKANPLFCDSY